MTEKIKNAVLIGAVILFCVMQLSGGGGYEDKYNIGYKVDDETQRVHFTTHIAHAGDTFWDIGEYYCNKDDRKLYIHEYLDEMRKLNPHLKERHYQLQPNDVVHVRYVYTVGAE